MNEWKKVILRDICESYRYGYTASAKEKPIGPKFLRITDIVPDLIDWDTVPFCKINEHEKEKYLLQEGDIVVARTGATTGYAKRIKQHPDVVFASYLVRLRIEPGVDNRFIGFILESDIYKEFVRKNMGGAAQPNANAQVLTSFPLLLPPLPTQRKIAAVLSAYDDLIENNTRRIRILEEMAQAIYREWFVHYRFPGHENVPLVDSGTNLGVIPEGWEVKPFSDLVEINPQLIVSKDQENPYIGMNAISTNSMMISTELIEIRKSNSGAKFQNRDVLFPRITPSVENGKCGFVNFLEPSQIAIGSTEIVVFREAELSAEYVYFLSLEKNFRQIAINSMIGASGRQRVQLECFNAYLISKPDEKINSMFAKLVSPMFEEILKLSRINSVLRSSRDLLLPKLISGELDVSNLEANFEMETQV